MDLADVADELLVDDDGSWTEDDYEEAAQAIFGKSPYFGETALDQYQAEGYSFGLTGEPGLGEYGREGIASKASDKTTLSVDAMNQRIKDRQHHIGHRFGGFVAVLHECAGHSAKARHINEQADDVEVPVVFPLRILFQNENVL